MFRQETPGPSQDTHEPTLTVICNVRVKNTDSNFYILFIILISNLTARQRHHLIHEGSVVSEVPFLGTSLVHGPDRKFTTEVNARSADEGFKLRKPARMYFDELQ